MLLFKNARVFDGHGPDCAEGMSVVVEGDTIREVSKKATAKNARVIDVKGRTLMPGLIDAHLHAYASDVNIFRIETVGQSYRAAHGIRMLSFALDCGFTTVRDAGGGDFSLAQAIADGLVRAPRYLYAGKALSMTGGHGDMRRMDETPRYHDMCSCGVFNSFCKIADGVDECVRATREELRQGAHAIKIMGSGGVASPTDPIWMNQYREDEIRAIVGECEARRSYVLAHCHPASAVRRCVEFGVRSIEHGTLIDDDTAKFVAKKGAFRRPHPGHDLRAGRARRKARLPARKHGEGADRPRRGDGRPGEDEARGSKTCLRYGLAGEHLRPPVPGIRPPQGNIHPPGALAAGHVRRRRAYDDGRENRLHKTGRLRRHHRRGRRPAQEHRPAHSRRTPPAGHRAGWRHCQGRAMKADRGIVEEVRDLAWTGHHAKAIATATGVLENARLDKSIALELLGLRSESYVAEGRLDPALADAKKMLAMAKASGRASHLATAHNAMALAQMRGSEFTAAAKSGTAALKEAERAKDKALQALCAMRLAEAKFRQRRADDAMPLARRALALYESLDDQVGLGRAYWTLASTLTQKGLGKECMEAATRSLEIARACGDLYGAGNALNMLTFHEPDFALSLKLRNQARDAFKAAGYVERQAMVMGNLGLLYARLGLLRRAFRLARDTAEIYTRTGTRGPLVTCLCFLSYRAAESGHIQAAREWLHKARAVAKGIDDNPLIHSSLESSEAWLARQGGDLRAAIKSYEGCMKLADASNDFVLLAELADTYLEAGNARAALAKSRQGTGIHRKLKYVTPSGDMSPSHICWRIAEPCGRPGTRPVLPRRSRRPTGS
jgi:imidazolonepropionase-like amidohydrolase/tetratricopeptide (TPR) repeat protein